MSITRIGSGLMVSSLDFRPRLFAIEICLSRCVVFYNRKLSLAPPSVRREYLDEISWDIQ